MSETDRQAALEDVGTDMLLDLVEHRGRLIDLEYRLTRIAAEKCGAMSRPHPGALIAKPSEFKDRAIQSVAAGVLTPLDEPSESTELAIVHLVPNGPFARAGLKKGDRVLAVDGRPIRSAAELVTLMLESGERTSARVQFERNGFAAADTEVRLDMTCPVRLALATGAYIVTWQTERLMVAVPMGLLHQATDDSTLAIAVSHQVAHALFDKPDDDALASEMRADRLGLQLAALAGYDIAGAVDYWEEIAIEYPSLISGPPPDWRPLSWEHHKGNPRLELPHPEIAKRMEAIREIVAAASVR